MTTIAWDGKTLAADRRSVAGGTPSIVCKIRKTSDGRLIAAAGNCDVCVAMLDWVCAGEPADRPASQLTEDYVNVIEITPDGRSFKHEKYGRFEVLSPFCASGSGRDFALSAMAFGKSAAEAVEFAFLFDVGSGDGVDFFTLGE